MYIYRFIKPMCDSNTLMIFVFTRKNNNSISVNSITFLGFLWCPSTNPDYEAERCNIKECGRETYFLVRVNFKLVKHSFYPFFQEKVAIFLFTR